MGVGILNDDRTEFITRQSLGTTPGVVDLTLPLPRLDAASDLVFQNWDSPEESVFDIVRVEVLLMGVASTGDLPSSDEKKAGRPGLRRQARGNTPRVSGAID